LLPILLAAKLKLNHSCFEIGAVVCQQMCANSQWPNQARLSTHPAC